MVSCLRRPGFFVRVWLAADLVCPSPPAFASFALGGEINLLRADLGADSVGRKRTEWISWDGFLSGV